MSRPFLGPVVWPNFGNIRDYLWQEIPQAHPVILELEERAWSIDGDCDIGAYGYLSEAFFWPVLVEAIDAESKNNGLLKRCFRFIELLLGSDDEYLVEATGIRILEGLCRRRRWLEAARVYGGPLLKRDIANYIDHPEWFDGDFEGPIPQNDPAEWGGRGPRSWLGG